MPRCQSPVMPTMTLPANLGMCLLWLVIALTGAAHAQFGGIFEQMFGGQQAHQHQHQPQNAPSDPSFYQQNVDSIHCSNYLCPDTLGTCVACDQMAFPAGWARQQLTDMCSQPVSTSHTIAHVRSRQMRTSLSWPMVSEYASPEVDSRLMKRPGRSS